jgi:hypothetical protein
MCKDSATPSDVCDLLNELLKLDYDCIVALVTNRKKCNEAIESHRTVQVQRGIDDLFASVGIVGILNGLFDINEDGCGALCYEVIDDRITCFKLTPTNMSAH